MLRREEIFLVMRLVEENMVDVNVRDHSGWRGWMYAARYGHNGLIEYFFDKKD